MIRDVSSGTGVASSLANINTTELPNGAACYVNEDAAWWVLVKGSTAAAVAGLVLVPGSGPGRWFLQAGSSAQAPDVQVLGEQNTWGENNEWSIATSLFFSIATPAPAGWALTELGSILTYTGAPRRFFAQFSASFESPQAASDAIKQAFAVISLNDDMTGAAEVGLGQMIELSVANVSSQLTVNRLLSLVSGDTVRPKVAIGPAPGPFTIGSICSTMVLIPL
jgi:hypothetical protein